MSESILNNKAKQDLLYTDKITGDQFEDLMTKVLKRIGYYDIVHTPYSNDGGVDAYSLDRSTSWQFKDYDKNRTVPYHAVEEVTNGFLLYKTKINIVLTNSYFSHHTYSICYKINQKHNNFYVKLVNRRGLFKIFKEYESLQAPVIRQIKKRKQILKRKNIAKRLRNSKIRQIKTNLGHIQYVHDMKLKHLANTYGSYSKPQDMKRVVAKHKAQQFKRQKIEEKKKLQLRQIRQQVKHQKHLLNKKIRQEQQQKIYQVHIKHQKEIKKQREIKKLQIKDNYQNIRQHKRHKLHHTASNVYSRTIDANLNNILHSQQTHTVSKYDKKFKSLPYIICPHCNAHISPNNKYCINCGYKVNHLSKHYKLYMIWLINEMKDNYIAKIPIFLHFNCPQIFNLLNNYLVCLVFGFFIGIIIGHIFLALILSMIIYSYFHITFNNYHNFIKKF